MDEKRKRFMTRMDELGLRNTDVDKKARLPSGATRDYLGRPERPGNEPSIERAMRFAEAVNWTLEQFYHSVDRIQLKLRLDGVSRGQDMWSSLEHERPELIPLDIPTKGLVTIRISRDGEVPQLGFRSGDTIVGNKFEGPNFGNLVRTECIICTEDGQRLMGVLHPGTKKGFYSVQPFNPLHEPQNDLKILWVAPIAMIIRGGN